MERYNFHFTPPKGWTNDPNGAICINGDYHLFYQHYPDDVVWGPMRWGHAVSKDLIHWEHKKIALEPDELGYIFSGSCIYDENFQGQGAMIAFYTAHNPITGEQQQCMAYSFDFENFIKYEGNPIIKNQKTDDNYMPDFRDPRVFANPVKGGYSMVLAAGEQLLFYHSDDLYIWTKTGEFDPSLNGFGGICECPDCFALADKWILTLSCILPNEFVGKSIYEKGHYSPHVMQYFVGTFDGNTFIDTERNQVPLILDYGPDNYAMITFSDYVSKTVMPDDDSATMDSKALMIGWGECWDYVNNTPLIKKEGCVECRGKMTVAREVSLVQTYEGYRLKFDFKGLLPKKIYRLNASENEKLDIIADNGHKLQILLENDSIVVSRPDSELTKEYNRFIVENCKNTECDILVVQDGNYFEILAKDGLAAISVMVY